MSAIRTVCMALAALGLLVGVSSTAHATLYQSLAAWNAAATPDISITDGLGNDPVSFFGSCSTSAQDNCSATDPNGPSPDPVLANNSLQATEDYINAHATFTVDLADSFDQAGDGGANCLNVVSGSCSTGATAYDTWVLKADNWIIAVLFANPTNILNFSGLHNELSHFSVGGNTSVIPLPPALLLLGSGLLGMTFLRRRRRPAA